MNDTTASRLRKVKNGDVRHGNQRSAVSIFELGWSRSTWRGLARRTGKGCFAANPGTAYGPLRPGGSKAFGGFDPWDKDATFLSVTLGLLYAIAMIAWPVALAVGFSRFRPRTREIKEQIRDTSILALQAEIAELRKQIALISRGSDSA